MTTWFVEPCPEKPDFRLVVTFLWGKVDDVDTDGDSDNPASPTWTWLHAKDRATPAGVVEIDEDEEHRVRVQSTTAWLAAACAYFLADEARARVSRDRQAWLERDALGSELHGFDLAAALARAATSIWRTTTFERPYPTSGRGEAGATDENLTSRRRRPRSRS